MTIKFRGYDGELRIYDATRQVPAADAMSVIVLDADPEGWTDKTTEARTDDTSYTGSFWAASGDKVYVGGSDKFAMINVILQTAAVSAGTLVAKYYNGSEFTALSGVADGTASGGDTMSVDGEISFKIPSDWAVGGDPDLESDMYYVELAPTSVPGTAPSADLLAPVDGQYLVVRFAAMDFSGPVGRPRNDEMLISDRGRVDPHAHYIEGPDDKLMEPLAISWSCLLDDTYNDEAILESLACGNPGTTEWGSAGVTTKGTTQNDGSNDNPPFADSGKKAVNVQMLFENSDGNTEGWAYYETFCPPEGQEYSESPEGVNLSMNGGVYGVIERISGFGVRY